MKPRTEKPSAEIPTSSIADIAFLLIIFFMVTVTFATSQGLDFKMPEEEHTEFIDPVESVLVEVQADSSLLVDGNPLDLGDLLGYLGPKLRDNPTKPVILKTQGDAPYGSMVEVFDVLRSAEAKLGLAHAVTIALPTEREVSQFWR